MAVTKQSIDVSMFWYTDVLVLPMAVTIVTTVGEDGRVNAAPYSLGTPYDVGRKTPQMLLGVRQATHTFKNILATNEYVINYPSRSAILDVMETARFWPQGHEELSGTGLTTVASQSVRPPSIAECRQHIECRLHTVITIDAIQSFILGDIVDIVVDKELVGMGRRERIEALDLPVYLGDERRRYFYFGSLGDSAMVELKRPDSAAQERIATTLPWDPGALAALNAVPSAMREVVAELVEAEARARGLAAVSRELYRELEERYAPGDMQEKFA
jgi:flavin reductase (DIM6/NTAB) family NADH-FMN oxidoreductase RutF